VQGMAQLRYSDFTRVMTSATSLLMVK
jgi:hypothetical protein